VKCYGKYGRKVSEKIWKIQKKSKLKSEKIGKIWKKSKLNSEKIWKIQKKIVKRFGKYRRNII
jgi:peptidoglycan hydrolase CwlO-like protein